MEHQVETNKTTSLAFKARRREPELISPAKPTPRELKILSNIDDQIDLRRYFHGIFFYKYNPSSIIKGSSDPVQVIRKALAETLVYYYPFAGRLWEGPNRKLTVDCNGEGVLFVEADAAVALVDFGEDLHPPFPCLEELLLDVEGSIGFLDSPLLLLQVTRLKCGGFIFGVSFNHVMCDGGGFRLFLRMLEELARGSNAPSIPPVWDRHLLNARDPPCVTHVHHEYDEDAIGDAGGPIPEDPMVQRSFFFGPKDISAIRRLVPSDLGGRITTFDLLASFLWRCRTIALRPLPDAKTRLFLTVNTRSFFRNPPLPSGYYGNVICSPVAITTAGELSERPLEFALRLVREAKSMVTEEYVRSFVDLLAKIGLRNAALRDTYILSDTRRLGFDDVDLGWGPPVYGGSAEGGYWGVNWLLPCKKTNGETGTVVQVILPEPAMERFAEQLALVFGDDGSRKPIRSSL
ncbi:PREDICTED: (Z)-3-hexen-1-ol acetyltransferase-like isoform X3 [Tarenaya hassleriana]|uniref:(Z)-3-hexen-1-ol acetyltransferase-like isoform X1 n=1 Tax=Tarenaya hassleriana TaxID=28532 RepID=UPI00053C2FAB|nr:PREDICTED: (Z)-3-hexen-1-ol acetyltransferase-like isoform X1 [Tarenaya hassleriana]XP_010521556.1 PREDICTED: (Z)-3-hexen-1-ol acetyltransferase-like isoform X2 [Tarenaya hassleriana]XP_010521557.1 PREDICTED: (Z)-3-hexen-1-ol acetyltransferase-like isoform X3 [Tarenaya hassleriana]